MARGSSLRGGDRSRRRMRGGAAHGREEADDPGDTEADRSDRIDACARTESENRGGTGHVFHCELLHADSGHSIGYEDQLADVVPAALDEVEPEEPAFEVAERTGWLAAEEGVLEGLDAPELVEWCEVDTCELVADAAGTAAAKPAVTAAPTPRAE
jgi:hypothetical protein